jgi:hypothetical protein
MLRRENRSPIEILGTTQQMLSTLALAAKMDSTEITLYSLCVKFLQYLLELEGWAKKHGRLTTARIVLTAEPPQSVLDNLLNGFRGCLVQMHSIASSQ